MVKTSPRSVGVIMLPMKYAVLRMTAESGDEAPRAQNPTKGRRAHEGTGRVSIRHSAARVGCAVRGGCAVARARARARGVAAVAAAVSEMP
jgi:hypothetical protein